MCIYEICRIRILAYVTYITLMQSAVVHFNTTRHVGHKDDPLPTVVARVGVVLDVQSRQPVQLASFFGH
ncbi:hypothetical protein PsorP6_011018 [Peronosclerospora sorghi]|uniref:Uncharacterized protein n=1 Tax=Peronosclerospora sorghi TaxID=230839 RepID=A0ACC0VVB6_9STRA|nr:hypothetical protein PsorP6_011018 [Peronosclerospora sorghi]